MSAANHTGRLNETENTDLSEGTHPRYGSMSGRTPQLVRAAEYVRMSTDHQQYSTENQAERGYSIAEIATKLDFSPDYIKAICFLLEHGEKRLLTGVDRGIIPHTIAMEIAKSNEEDVQRALADAYEKKTLPGNQVLAIRRIIEERRRSGKSIYGTDDRPGRPKKQITAESLVRAYQKETDRQKLLVKKAGLAQSRLLFVVNSLRKLLADEHFVTLLRAEGMNSIPRSLLERVGGKPL